MDASAALWLELAGERPAPRPPLRGRHRTDVAVVGAGYTGLWTAYQLRRAEPGLTVTVVDREHVGFGASGRNGGWCSALFAAPWARVAAVGGADGARALYRALADTVDDVGRFCATEEVDAGYEKAGQLTLARSPAQRIRLDRQVREAQRWGVAVRPLDAAAVAARVRVPDALAGAWFADCAVLQPVTLVRGLAAAAERLGARIHERTPVLRVDRGEMRLADGRLTADVVVLATEGYTAGLPGHRRAVVPVYSLMVATEPLPAQVWAELGWRTRFAVADARHLIVYAQRTADGRIAFGGRGAPYHFGSRIRDRFDVEPRVFAALGRELSAMFPSAAGARLTHRWGGPLGVSRDWFPTVFFDRDQRLAGAWGYAGDGVACAALAGRTLADLIRGRDSELTRLPWVGHRSPRWEPEPLRSLGVNAGLRLMANADAVEARTGRPARRAGLVHRLLGG